MKSHTTEILLKKAILHAGDTATSVYAAAFLDTHGE